MSQASAEASLRALLDQQRLMLDSLAEGVLLLDSAGAIVSFNAAARQVLPGLALGASLAGCSPAFYERFKHELLHALSGHSTNLGRVSFTLGGHELHVRLRLTYLPSGAPGGTAQPHLLLNLENITPLIEAYASMEQAYSALDHQLMTARKYQQALFTNSLETQHLSCRAVGQPAYELSGDFFNVGRAGDRYLITLGDVQSHGLEVAIKAIALQHLCRQNLGQVPVTGELMATLNTFVLGDALEGFWSCCMFVASYDPLSRSLYYSRAGIPEPLLFHPGGLVEFLAVGDSPLGYFEDETYHGGLVFVQPGDRLLLMSDGVTECRLQEDPLEFYGHAHLVRDYLKLCEKEPSWDNAGSVPQAGDSATARAKPGYNTVLHLLPELLARIVARHGGSPFQDDFTLSEIVFR
jgi:hypothetical protein